MTVSYKVHGSVAVHENRLNGGISTFIRYSVKSLMAPAGDDLNALCCRCLTCAWLHTEVQTGGQTHLSSGGGRGDAKKAWLALGALRLDWLWEPIRRGRGRAAESGFIPSSPPLSSSSIFLSAAGCLTCSKTSENPWWANGNCFSKLGRFWQWFKKMYHHDLNRPHLICPGKL